MKLTAKQARPGMEFEMSSIKEINLWGEFVISPLGTASFDCSNVPSLGDQIIITSGVYKKNGGGALVDWTNTRTGKTGSTFWSVFKDSTTYIGGTSIPKLPGVVVTSSGPFNGFDITLEDKTIHPSGSPFIECIIKFEGTFTGGKKITTKMIQDIKKAPGFDHKLRSLLVDPINHSVDPKLFCPLPTTGYNKDLLGTSNYSGGKIQFMFYLQNDALTTIDNINKFIDGWMAQKNTAFALEKP